MSTARECCWHCTERRVGCHGSCERYAAWLKAERERKDAERAAKAEKSAMDEYVIERIEKLKRRIK